VHLPAMTIAACSLHVIVAHFWRNNGDG